MKSKEYRLNIEQLETKRVLSSVVAVLDSGMDIYHKDLIDNVWINSQEIINNNIDDDNNGYIDDIYGWNFVNNTNNVLDVYGHGTHVAGIIQGVNPSVKLMVLKVIGDTGVGSTSAVLYALDYVNNMASRENIVATNNSWTLGSNGSNLVKGRIQALSDRNIIFVSAAGNNATNIDINPNYPSSFKLPNIISVASITSEGVLAGSSNYGPQTVHLAARGVVINSTWPNNRYAILSGTSMAAPMVSGKVSMMNGSVSEKVFALLSEVVKTDSLSTKVVSGGYLKESWSFKIDVPVASEVIRGGAGIVSMSRVRGWSYSSTLDTKPILIKVMVNNRLVAAQWANLYRPDLIGVVGSANHGFDIRLNRFMFRRGWNSVRIYAVNTENNNMKLLASRSIHRYI
jgi:hypothetical protein